MNVVVATIEVVYDPEGLVLKRPGDKENPFP
jgi:hypothetical protein